MFLLIFTGVTVYVYFNSQRTFEAKFKNVDGLPKGAQVTLVGVPIGHVIKTRPLKDGVMVTVRITNRKIPRPEAGSQLAITSFRPGYGRVLEIIPPQEKISNTAWIVQEPITVESWLEASLYMFESLKSFSENVIRNLTPENVETARQIFLKTSDSLEQTAGHFIEQQDQLVELKGKIDNKVGETNELFIRLQKPITSLNKLINDKNLPRSLKSELSDFSNNLLSISDNLTNGEFISNVMVFKTMILDRLNEINVELIAADEKVKNSDFSNKLMIYNYHLKKLNDYYATLNAEQIKTSTRTFVKKAKEGTMKTAELSKKVDELTDQKNTAY